MANIGIIGAGSWGTALAVLLGNNGHTITLWSALEREVSALSKNRELPSIPGIQISDSTIVTGELSDAIKNQDVLVLAVASSYTRETAHKMAEYLVPGQVVVNVGKGIEEKTLYVLSQVIEEELPQADVAVMSGPSHAEEVGKGIPTTCVVGAHSKKTAEYVQNLFMSPVFRVYTSPDMLGIELGAALKKCDCFGSRHCRWPWLWGQYKSSINYKRDCRDCKAWHENGRDAPNIFRVIRDWGFNCHLRKYAQPEPQGWYPYWAGLYHGRGNGRSKNGSRRCLFCKSSFGISKKISSRNANCGTGKPSAF